MDEIEINGTYIDILVFVTKMLVNPFQGGEEKTITFLGIMQQINPNLLYVEAGGT